MKIALPTVVVLFCSLVSAADPPSIANNVVPAGWVGPVQSAPQPPGLPVQAPYPIADWWISQIYKWSANPSPVPQGNETNPLPFNLIVGFNGLAIFHPYATSAASTVACGGGATACPGFESIQPHCYLPEILPGLAASADYCPFWWPDNPVVAVQGFSTWSETFDVTGPNHNGCGPTNEPQRLRATTARGSPYVWIEFPDASDSAHFDMVQVQFNDASGQIFGSDCPPSDPPCPANCNVNAQPYQIWTNSSSFATSVNTQAGDTQGQPDAHIAVVSVNGRTYAIIGPEGSYWEWKNFTPQPWTGVTFFNRGVTGGAGSRWVVVAGLPANTDALIAANQWTRADAVQLLASHAYFRPANESSRTATKLTCAYAASGDNNVTGTFLYEALTDIRTGQPASASEPTLFALFPHQQAHLTTPAVLTSQQAYYSSVKGYARSGQEPRGGFTEIPPPSDAGQMRLAEGRSFTLGYTLPTIPPVVPAQASFTGDMTKLNLYLDNDPLKYAAPLGADTYNWGKHLARCANNYLIATAVNHSSAAFWKTQLSDGLSGWFTATQGGGTKPVHPPCPPPAQPGDPPPPCDGPFPPGFFSYDSNWGSAIGYPAGFGSNTFLNDHHFHYGYFLRAAAVLAGADSAWRDTYRPFVEFLVRDLAADYNDSASVGGVATQFAAYNYFDPYSGHSNAAGVQQYANGVNEESSSEGVNAWYGMLLWADVVNDSSMKARAAFMYCSEADAARRYWFQEESQLAGNNPVTSGTLANIFDNVSQYAGFSKGPTYLHIINWLPFGGGATYLAANTPYAALNYNRLVTEWGSTNWPPVYWDLIMMYRAISDPADAKAQFTAKIGSTNGNEFDCDSGNTLGMTYWWICSQSGGLGGPITGDLNGDGHVDGADLGLLLGNWNQSGLGDLNRDGVVNGADLGLLLGNWTG